ncbi:NAD(P)H-dependent flavin oxidoreductase [Serratia odorifera]|uniref:NAD(P)H-dependent flavin oxidoreductase n=1 Tax=Serratia odorifera TaxID=618 RepID=UPI003D27B82D
MKTALCTAVNLQYPLVQAPMAGVSTPELAAAVSNAGALGSISVGASTPEQAEAMIAKTQSLTSRPINVNVFCHPPVQRDQRLELAWIRRFETLFDQYAATPPAQLSEIYQTFHDNPPMLEVLLARRPSVVSFHFGIPSAAVIDQLKARGIVTFATATSPDEARQIAASDIDFIVAQGIEAGGHRGQLDPRQDDGQLSTFTLLQAIKAVTPVPVIAAGGVMDGAGIAAMRRLGATGVQMGTAFILCLESAANQAYRHALKSPQAATTVMTSAISGRPARCIDNAFCQFTRRIAEDAIPPYPLTYALGKALAVAAAAKGEHGFGAQWAGQGVSLIREMPADRLVQTLVEEWQAV